MIYLDHHASTPLAPEVIAVMGKAMQELFGNPGSVHAPGRAARAAVDQARRRVAALINSREREIVFTSGGTEASNLALRGAWRARRAGRNRIITSSVEHPAVLSACHALEADGAELVLVPVLPGGELDQNAFSDALDETVAVVSIMHANNETGVIFPVEELAKQARRCGAWMHVDAVQTGGRLPLDVNRLGVDLLSLSSHKIRGPKGAGALFVSREIDLQPITFGGKQEAGLRAGTENTLSIVGFGRAAELAREGLSSEPQRLAALRDGFEAQLLESLAGLRVHGALQERLPSVTNLGFDGIEGEAALLMLDMAGVCASSGSACASGSLEPSHVLLAMGYSAEQAHGSIRFSFGHGTRAEQLERVVELLIEKVPQLRALMLTI
ncbi:MAG: cysteine desulfurase family protein [Myxococcota bacterium]|nr:cysteine desulfurase family protein [Myxococcota bacterium]